jgi:TolB-like protein/Tfp pilus assembly protein PilF
MDIKKLYKELVRRNVFRAVLAYLAVAWVLIEAASTILPTFGAPEYVIKGLIYLLSIGLVIWAGFSWVYDLTPEGIRKTPEAYDTPETRQMNSRRLNAVIIVSVFAAVLVLVAGSFWAGSRWGSEQELAGSSGYRIAVLPFEDRSDNAEFDYLREGLAEDVISKLLNFSEVAVISSRSAFQFKDTDKSIGEISGELNADIVLIGNYTITNQKVDVKVEVIDPRADEILNYASILGDLEHISDISSRIGAHLKESLGITADEMEAEGKIEARSVNPEAFKFYALGKSAMRDHTGQKLEDITKYFQAAIELDPDYSDPYIGMAEAYLFDINRGYLSPTEGAAKAKNYALKAEKLNPGSGEVSGLLGSIHFCNYDFERAVPYFEKSLEESPNFTLAYQWYSFILYFFGDFDRAEELQRKAALLDPLDNLNDMYLAINYIFRDKLGQAEKFIDAKLSLNPDHLEMIWLKSVLLVEKGMYQEAYETILKRKKFLETNFLSGYILARVGKEEQAVIVLNKIMERSEKQYVPPSQIAMLMCGLGLYDQALDQIEEAFLAHDLWIGWIHFTSMADPIKDDPRYISLMKPLIKG